MHEHLSDLISPRSSRNTAASHFNSEGAYIYVCVQLMRNMIHIRTYVHTHIYHIYIHALFVHQIVCSAELWLRGTGKSPFQKMKQAQDFKARLEAEKTLAAKAHSITLLNLDDEERLLSDASSRPDGP